VRLSPRRRRFPRRPLTRLRRCRPKLPLYLSSQGLLAAGFNYHVVAVFGSQSTGKSTLLNHLFGTDFNVMDETARQQTTKGIWLSRAKEDEQQSESGMTRNILVMDVEGTDGRERGEDQDFERKSALFALATSEVLVRLGLRDRHYRPVSARHCGETWCC